jgi:multicomponent Na+:H+ antiporter subunit G
MTFLDVLRMGLGGLIVVAGLGLILGGVVGLLRFPDFYTRLHAASVSDGAGAAIFALGLAVMAPDAAMAVRLMLFAALAVALGPVFTHMLASSAHAGGLAPIAGRYSAPRPGARRPESAP